MRRYAIKEEREIEAEKEKLKQKIQAKAQRIQRFQKRSKEFRQNRLFKSKPKVSNRELGKNQIEINDPPSAGGVEVHWKSILEDDKITTIRLTGLANTKKCMEIQQSKNGKKELRRKLPRQLERRVTGNPWYVQCTKFLAEEL